MDEDEDERIFRFAVAHKIGFFIGSVIGISINGLVWYTLFWCAGII